MPEFLKECLKCILLEWKPCAYRSKYRGYLTVIRSFSGAQKIMAPYISYSIPQLHAPRLGSRSVCYIGVNIFLVSKPDIHA